MYAGHRLGLHETFVTNHLRLYQALEKNQTHENDILDYKTGLIDDDQLIKHVTAFANTRGGYIVFGVEETGKGGFPKAIPGIDQLDINKERMEQILLSNISPRVSVKMLDIPIVSSQKRILVLQIPDSSLKPHMNLRLKKYMKRYEFEAVDMDERQVTEAYRTRFSSYDEVEKYLKNASSRIDPKYNVKAQILVIPTVLDTRLVDTSDRENLAWLKPGKIHLQPSSSDAFVPDIPTPSPRGVVCQKPSRYLEVHRNGCVEYGCELVSVFTAVEKRDSTRYFPYVTFCIDLLHALQFASTVYSQYNYFGEVKAVVSIKPTDHLVLPPGVADPLEDVTCRSGEIWVDRNLSSTILESDFSPVAASIMHDIFSCFGQWRCPLFDSKGHYIVEKLK